MIDQRQFQSWCVRAPWAMFGCVPLLLFAAAWCIALFILWTGWNIFLPDAASPFGAGHYRMFDTANLYFQFGRTIRPHQLKQPGTPGERDLAMPDCNLLSCRRVKENEIRWSMISSFCRGHQKSQRVGIPVREKGADKLCMGTEFFCLSDHSVEVDPGACPRAAGL